MRQDVSVPTAMAAAFKKAGITSYQDYLRLVRGKND